MTKLTAATETSLGTDYSVGLYRSFVSLSEMEMLQMPAKNKFEVRFAIKIIENGIVLKWR
jgi:hypothetical protein